MNLAAATWMPALGWTLVHFLWQGMLIGIASALVLACLPRARPQLRYAVACAALVLCVAWPAWQFNIELASGSVPSARPANATIVDTAPTFGLVHDRLAAWQPAMQDRLPWIVRGWALGAALLALRLLAGLAWVGHVRRDTQLNPGWQRRLDELALRMGIARTVGLRLTDRADSPLTAGWWRPVVIVPTALIARLPADLLEALIAHELAHVRRHDYFVNLLQHAVEALLFYHPVVWWLSREIRIEREQIADDLAARVLGEPRRLAMALQELDHFQLTTSQLALAAHGGQLMSRIQRLIRPTPHTFTWRFALPLLGASALCLAAYAQTPPAATTPVPAMTTTPSALAADADANRSDDLARADDWADDALRGEQGYAVVRADRNDIQTIGDSGDRSEVERLRQHVAGDFVWVRRNDQRFLIRDPSIVAAIDKAWRALDPLNAQMDALNQQMKPNQSAMDALNQRMHALELANRPDTSRLDALAKEMEPYARQEQQLGEQMAELSAGMDRLEDAERAARETKLDALRKDMDAQRQRIEAISRQIEAQSRLLADNAAPMTALGRQMEEAARPMQALGEKMSSLGNQIGHLSRQADQQSRTLIDQAIEAGKAQPTP